MEFEAISEPVYKPLSQDQRQDLAFLINPGAYRQSAEQAESLRKSVGDSLYEGMSLLNRYLNHDDPNSDVSRETRESVQVNLFSNAKYLQGRYTGL